MTDDDFDRVFGSRTPNAPTFADRVTRGEAFGGRAEPKPAASVPTGDPKEGTAGSGPYKPYGFLPTAHIGESCDVQRWLDSTEIAEGIEFQYRFLMQIGYVGEEQIRLFLPDCIVVIEGKRLRDLRKKLARRQVTFIQQFNPRVWPGSPPANEPLIERIEVVRPEALNGRT